MSAARATVAGARRLVVKVGSSSLTSVSGGLDVARLDALVDAIGSRVHAGTQVVLVSSGAIAVHVGTHTYEVEFRGDGKAHHVHNVILHFITSS